MPHHIPEDLVLAHTHHGQAGSNVGVVAEPSPSIGGDNCSERIPWGPEVKLKVIMEKAQPQPADALPPTRTVPAKRK